MIGAGSRASRKGDIADANISRARVLGVVEKARNTGERMELCAARGRQIESVWAFGLRGTCRADEKESGSAGGGRWQPKQPRMSAGAG